MSYKLVEDLQKKACPKVAASQACCVLEVSRSGYYANEAALKQRVAAPIVCAASVYFKACGSRRLRTEYASGEHQELLKNMAWRAA